MSDSLEQLFAFLRFASVSTDSTRAEDCRACAQWLQTWLEQAGFESQLWETAGHPAVFAQAPHQEDKPTLLVYGHYDVQPTDPNELWETPPFEPQLIGEKIFARGATDNKGQIFAHLWGAAQLLRNQGSLPINLKFIIEGEEEIGSPHFKHLLQEHSEELACDVIAVSDTGMVSPGQPTLGYGLRGIACLEFTLSGPSSDLHSGVFGGAVQNPATALAHLIASLHDENGRITVEGFYEAVRDPDAWEKEAWARLPNGEDYIREFTQASPHGEANLSSYERLWARPTAEINGLWGGYQGEGSKTIVPSQAGAKLSCRLVPEQQPEEILDALEAHLRTHCPPAVELKIERGHYGGAYLSDPHSAWGKAAQKALQNTFPDKELALIREGGSIPIIPAMSEALQAEVLLLGLALADANIHAPNEHFPMANFEGGIALHQALLQSLAEIS